MALPGCQHRATSATGCSARREVHGKPRRPARSSACPPWQSRAGAQRAARPGAFPNVARAHTSSDSRSQQAPRRAPDHEGALRQQRQAPDQQPERAGERPAPARRCEKLWPWQPTQPAASQSHCAWQPSREVGTDSGSGDGTHKNPTKNPPSSHKISAAATALITASTLVAWLSPAAHFSGATAMRAARRPNATSGSSQPQRAASAAPGGARCSLDVLLRQQAESAVQRLLAYKPNKAWPCQPVIYPGLGDPFI